MKKTKREVVVLKIGGSIVTYKGGDKVRVRKTRLKEIAEELVLALRRNPHRQLILVHGAGSAGHVLANKYNLKAGVNGDSNKIQAALRIRENNQLLNLVITKIFSEAGLPIVPVHSGSAIIQNNGKLRYINTELVKCALDNQCIPTLYGEMVFDQKLGMSVCSGDDIATTLAASFAASKLIYASDIDGIYDSDPYINKQAQLIARGNLKNINASIGNSHNVDVTGGLAHKIELVKNAKSSLSLKELIIFNGFKKGNVIKIFDGEYEGCSVLDM